ncbi:MAG: hypothetical protein WCA77_09480, partial [Thermoplasmata archaeon]
MVYNRGGDHRFRLIALSNSSGSSGHRSPLSEACGSITSQVGGTAGYLPFFTGTMPLCNVEVSNIFQSSLAIAYIGIGTASPTHALDVVNGQSGAPTELRVTNTSASNSLADITVAAAGPVTTQFEADSGLVSMLPQGIIGTITDNQLSITTNHTARMVIDTKGNVMMSGPSPWIDVTAPPYNADPSGAMDSTSAINAAVGA